jgi:hypothetical protein
MGAFTKHLKRAEQMSRLTFIVLNNSKTINAMDLFLKKLEDALIAKGIFTLDAMDKMAAEAAGMTVAPPSAPPLLETPEEDKPA